MLRGRRLDNIGTFRLDWDGQSAFSWLDLRYVSDLSPHKNYVGYRVDIRITPTIDWKRWWCVEGSVFKHRGWLGLRVGFPHLEVSPVTGV